MNSTSTPQPLTLVEHLTYICSRFLAYGVPLLFFLVTSSFYLKTYDSAQVKITFTQIGTTVLLFVWLAKILLEGRLPFTKKDVVFVAPFLAFLASGLVAYWLTPFKEWSMEETLRRVFYMTLALITIAEMRSSERMNRLWRWLIAAAWVAIGYGVLQYLDSRLYPAPGPGIDPFIWRQAFGHRVFSTFGNPNFYGNFLVILTPLIMASVLRNKGSLVRLFGMVAVTLGLILLIDNMYLGVFWTFDSSFSIVYYALIILLIFGFFAVAVGRTSHSMGLPALLILFAFLFINLYSTETKGAWIGFTTAVAATMLLILEYFLRLEERSVDAKKYVYFGVGLVAGFSALVITMVYAFVVPLFNKSITQIGFQILWIPTLLAAVIGLVTSIWVFRPPWNLKKVVYGTLLFFVLAMGAGVTQFAKTRLTSVSFRLFTWISTWEMIRTSPILGNGVGTFKVIYPAYRRPQIIVLEGKSNTETDHSEDEYIEVWQDEGLVGFGIFLWLILTALVCGFKQLRWYAKLRSPDPSNKRALLHVENDPRSYEVLGVLGAYIGALIHWSVDVSIRFVSSGVFSGLLPGLLVAYARNHTNPILHEVRLPYERWIRVGVAGFWTAVMLYLRMELVPTRFIVNGDTTDTQITLFCILAGVLLFALLELLEIGMKPDKPVAFSEQYPPTNPNLLPLRGVAVIVLLIVTLNWVRVFGNHFQADVHHNLAIFFSKQAIWEKLPRYESTVNTLPPDIREQYRAYGGALEHYAQVEKKNPSFPMARYFTGNVHNDRGSEYIVQAFQARDQGNTAEAERLKQKAFEEWEKSEEAYNRTKKLAPNYVQTHHQMGLLMTKRADAAARFGDEAGARNYYAEALKHFYLYKHLDPVFPPNYDRLVQILLMDRKFDEAKALYREAIYQNDVVARSIRANGYPDRVSQLLTSLAKVYYSEALSKSPNPFNPKLKEIDEAIENFKLAAETLPENVEAWKGLGFMYERTGQGVKAQEAYRRAKQLAPNDPDLKFMGSG